MQEGCKWPNLWPQLESFLGPLRHILVSLDFKPLMQGDEILIRFENGYGLHILRNRLQKWLSEVAVIRFSGSGTKDFDFVWNLPIPDLSWCYTVKELLAICVQVAALQPSDKCPNVQRNLNVHLVRKIKGQHRTPRK